MSASDTNPAQPSLFEQRSSRRRVLLGAIAGAGALAVTGVSTATIADAYPWHRRLQRGHTGSDVRELQIRVAGFAASSATRTYLAIDGVFGDATYRAVRRFQSAWNLGVDGIVGPETQGKLNWLEGANNSTRHFAFTEFHSGDGSGFGGGRIGSSTVKSNVRKMMWKLEAVRRKGGNNPIHINSGFRSVAFNASVGGTPNSHHMYGTAADIRQSNRSVSQVISYAKTSGFSGIIRYSTHTHVDNRAEVSYGEGPNWYWAT
jgi:hypothetical protein